MILSYCRARFPWRYGPSRRLAKCLPCSSARFGQIVGSRNPFGPDRSCKLSQRQRCQDETTRAWLPVSNSPTMRLMNQSQARATSEFLAPVEMPSLSRKDVSQSNAAAKAASLSPGRLVTATPDDPAPPSARITEELLLPPPTRSNWHGPCRHSGSEYADTLTTRTNGSIFPVPGKMDVIP